MAAGHVNRAELQSYYQQPGEVYDDTKTEGAMEVLAQQIDDNYDAYAAHRTALPIDHPDGSITGAKIANGTLTAEKFVPGALTNDTQNALRITSLENTKAKKGSPQRYVYDYVNGFSADATKGSSYYYKDEFNQVFCHISLKKSGASDDITTAYFTTLPEGFRPYQVVNAVIECVKVDNVTRFTGRIEVYPSGLVAIYVPQSCAFVCGMVSFNTFQG